LEDREVEVEVPPRNAEKGGVDMPGGTQIFMELVGKVGKMNGKKNLEKRRMLVKEARPILEDQIGEQLLEEYDVVKEAVAAVEESGIVFIDEIDKLVTSGEYRGADASSEGVQRDLLPLIEGCTISTKHGNVNTDFILFICSGAFHSTKPSDLLAELQGRLPIRVQLKGLTEDDLYRILTEPVTNLLRQQREMLKTENVTLSFTEKAIREIAKVAHETNRTVENIGARRLHTVIERIVEEISFDAPSREGEEIEIDEEFVKARVAELMAKSDLRKYIL
jgi:ATP-dependent HslUV protease ATP-binding subunit HslU